tara:strand:+ start:377 stop:868 length:492 start_codon:yes stop_codon:yes gene_type:complete
MKNFILIFLIFFSFDSMSQMTVESVINDGKGTEYNKDLGWNKGRNYTSEDVIFLNITDDNTIPPDHVKLMLSKTSNVSWWKGVYCDRNKSNILHVWNDGDHQIDGPQTFTAPLEFFKSLDSRTLELAKAKFGGTYTGMYKIIPVGGWEGGKSYHFIWEADKYN